MPKPFAITTGVHNANDVDWLWEEEGIDLAWEEHLETCPNEYHDFCGPETQGTTLYGNWVKEKGQYHPKRGGEFAAIYNPDHNTIQVVSSRYVIKCYHCSPCYPGQGDVDTSGDMWAYCLPPDMMREEWVKENAHRIYQYDRTGRSHYWKKFKQAS